MEDDVDPEIKKSVQKRVFTVEKKPLEFIRAKGNYNYDPRTVKVFHGNMCEIEVHFWRNGLTPRGNLHMVDYTRGGCVPSYLPRWTDTIDNLILVRSEDIVYTDQKGNNNNSLMIRLEQKSVPCLQTKV